MEDEVFTAAIDGFIYTRQMRTTADSMPSIEIIETQEQVTKGGQNSERTADYDASTEPLAAAGCTPLQVLANPT